MGRIRAGMAADFLEVDRIQAFCKRPYLIQPSLEAQIPHASSLEAPGLEGDRSTRDRTIANRKPPACCGSKIKGKD
jgi:hypothetical protein